LKLFKWDVGRQDSGYRVFTLLYSKLLSMDCCIIHYRTGSFIPEHTDRVQSGQMYRLNVELWKASKGGKFVCDVTWSLFDRIHFFRPDVQLHHVTQIEQGNRWVFSIGKIINGKTRQLH
jgi:hypothetical protein